MIRRSIEAAKAMALFFRYKNDLDIYYEDLNDDEFYKELLRLILPKNTRVGKLISLGNKYAVIKACSTDQVDTKRKRLYMVDGDMELILGTNPNNLKYLHVHDAYCIENFLVEEGSVVEVLHDTYQIDRKKLSQALGFNKWLKGISMHLVELFLHYAIVHSHCKGVKTVSLGVDRLCEKKKLQKILSGELVIKEIARLRAEILLVMEEEEYDERIYDLRLQWPAKNETLLQVVSGKDFLLPLIHCRMHKIVGKNSLSVSLESLRMRLLKYSSLETFAPLKNRLSTV